MECKYETRNQKAVAGKDYVGVEGTLKWTDGDMSSKEITVIINDDDEFEKDEDFLVVLTDVKGAAFPANTDGGEEEDKATVTIIDSYTHQGAPPTPHQDAPLPSGDR